MKSRAIEWQTVILEMPEGPIEFRAQAKHGGAVVTWLPGGRHVLTGKRCVRLGIGDRLHEALKLLEEQLVPRAPGPDEPEA